MHIHTSIRDITNIHIYALCILHTLTHTYTSIHVHVRTKRPSVKVCARARTMSFTLSLCIVSLYALPHSPSLSIVLFQLLSLFAGLNERPRRRVIDRTRPNGRFRRTPSERTAA